MTSDTGPTPHRLGSLADERLGAVVATMAGRERLPTVLAMAEIGVKLARLADRIHDDVPLRPQGEVRTAGHLASAAARAAAELVAIDLGELSQDARAGRAFEPAAEAAAHALTLAERPLRGR